MGTFVSEIITLYSARLMVEGKESINKYFNITELSIVKDNNFDAFKRAFPICDVAQGLIGNSLILSKGNPPV